METATSSSTAQRAHATVEHQAERVNHAVDHTAQRAHSTVEHQAERASHVVDHTARRAHQAVDQADRLTDRASERYQQVRQQAEDRVQHHPLRALGVAAAVGMVVGWLLHRSD